MGIRNLAYCVLDVPCKGSAAAASSPSIPSMHAWQRLAVSTSSPGEKEAFDPATLSTIAYDLVRQRLLPQMPTHILIERQRFRSMGSKHILEWTVRVNMLEAILYGVLGALKAEGVWEGEVVGVPPGKVGPFWLSEEPDGEAGEWRKERKGKNAKSKNKGIKIDFVRGWLENRKMVSLGNEEVEAMAKLYMEKWDRTPGGRRLKTKVDEEGQVRKLDDLADCLLQGMAWIQWQENKRMALKHGVESLLVF
jgi:cruciform cutting endonuclease 1